MFFISIAISWPFVSFFRSLSMSVGLLITLGVDRFTMVFFFPICIGSVSSKTLAFLTSICFFSKSNLLDMSSIYIYIYEFARKLRLKVFFNKRTSRELANQQQEARDQKKALGEQ